MQMKCKTVYNISSRAKEKPSISQGTLETIQQFYDFILQNPSFDYGSCTKKHPKELIEKINYLSQYSNNKNGELTLEE